MFPDRFVLNGTRVALEARKSSYKVCKNCPLKNNNALRGGVSDDKTALFRIAIWLDFSRLFRYNILMPNRIHNDTFDWTRLHQLCNGKVLLSFSCGKDSLATWLALREHEIEVVPYYLQLVPGLEFVEHSLGYYERFFGTHIYRALHPNFYRRLHEDWYQPPGRVAVIEQLSLPLFDYDDVADGIRRTAGLPHHWQAVGTRKAESVLRANRMKKDGFNLNRRVVTPIMDWNKAQVLACLERNKCPLPIDYEMFGRSFDGLYARYLIPIRDRFPRDYARILQFFPFADAEIARDQLRQKYAHQS